MWLVQLSDDELRKVCARMAPDVLRGLVANLQHNHSRERETIQATLKSPEYWQYVSRKGLDAHPQPPKGNNC